MIRSIAVTITILIYGVAFSQTKSKVSTNDFKNALGVWKGTLKYLDYSSGKPYTMPVNISIGLNTAKVDEIIFAFVYPDEPKANGNDTLIINKNGIEINGAAVTEKHELPDGTLQIITETKGVDGNDHRKAVLRHIYSISKTVFKNRKEVRFEGEEKWILRNEYSFNRQ